MSETSFNECKSNTDNESESFCLEMIEQELDDEPHNLGEKQVSKKQKVTLENVRENGCPEMFAHELDDKPNSLGEKQVSSSKRNT